MALTDNLVLKIQPVAGDTYIKNLITVEDVAASGAGTITLVDDAGLAGWKVAGVRQGTFTGGAAYEGGSFTLAVRYKANTRAADYAQHLALTNNVVVTSGFGAQITNNGTTTGALRVREVIGGSGFTVVGSPAYTTGQYFTAVMRFADNGAGTGTLEVFLKQTGRVNNNPDYIVSGVSTNRGGVLAHLFLGATGTDNTFVDMAAWMRGVTDAEAAAVADDIRGQLTTAVADPSATLAWTEDSDTASITANVAITTVDGTMAWTEASDTSASTATVASATGTITVSSFTNNTGTVLVSLTGLTVTVLNLSTMAFVKTFTGQTTNASGVMTLTDALLIAGTEYAVVTTNAAKTLGVEKYTAT